MFAVIFAVQPKQERRDDYLKLARFLKPRLEAIDGFIDNERFASTRTEGRVLSLSTWRDEKAVVRWRTEAAHHEVQEKGRFEIFADYHLRVGEITADTDVPAGHRLEEQRFDETAVGAAKVVTISELAPAAGDAPAATDLAAALGLPKADRGIVDHEVFESIYAPGKLLLLAAWRDDAAARGWQPTPIARGTLRHRRVRIIRDYGMFDRAEAPQYYPGVDRAAGGPPATGRRAP